MTTIWYQCEDCIFGSNSSGAAHEHTLQKPGHKIMEESEETDA